MKKINLKFKVQSVPMHINFNTMIMESSGSRHTLNDNKEVGIKLMCAFGALSKTFLILSFALCILSFKLDMAFAAGQGGLDIAILRADVGARPLGMGGAFTAVADNADAPYYNAAGLAWLSSSEITTMQTKLSTDADHYYVSYVRPLWGGSFGASWIQIGLGNINQVSKEVDNVNEVQNLNTFSYFSNAYLFAYGRKLNENISLGLTGTYLASDMNGISGGQSTGYSLTPGIMVKARKFTFGAKLEDAFNRQTWGTGASETAPSKLRLGMVYQPFPWGKLSLDLRASTLTSGYEWESGGLSFRAGASEGGITAGAGFAINHARVDYGYITQRSMSLQNVHRISLSGVW